jgi:hypothetical protein
MFINYLGDEKPVREAAELVANRRKSVVKHAPRTEKGDHMIRGKQSTLPPLIVVSPPRQLAQRPFPPAYRAKHWKTMPVSGIVWRSR